MSKKVGIISLGCQKNLVDSEVMIGVLYKNGYELTNDFEEASLIVINTCAFIGDARVESEEHIDEFAKWKRQNSKRKLIVTGCYIERLKDEVLDRWPEIDGIVGVKSLHDFEKLLKSLSKKNKRVSYINRERVSLEYDSPRIITSASASSYIKIAEGCDNFCSYCLIPSIRGRFGSRAKDAIMQEVNELVEVGISEINLIAQDTAAYGKDLDNYNLAKLLNEVCLVPGIKWVRLLYSYPDNITDELIDVIGNQSKICKYLDIPMQHVSSNILRGMNRKGNKQDLIGLVTKLRERIPGVVIRTTFIVGFPGETDDDFNELIEFIRVMKLDKVGFFKYSLEADTPAAKMDNQVSEELKDKRLELAIREQSKVIELKNKELVGKAFEVIVDGPRSGRYYAQAPEVDGIVHLDKDISIGEFVTVKIVGNEGIDLIGEVIQ